MDEVEKRAATGFGVDRQSGQHLSISGPSPSIEKRGVRVNVGVPGTGVSYSKKISGGKKKKKSAGCCPLALLIKIVAHGSDG